MDFFQSQDRAKQRTNLLVTLYSIAVVLLILAIYFIIVAIFRPEPKPYEILTFKERWWEPATFIYVTLGTLLIVGLGSAYRIKTLSGGGGEVAKMLGGRKISNNTDDLNEKKILNVVEEMALASGIPVPPVYLLDNEPTINAFAAGFSPESAVIGVT
ncbi:MAG: hypothetical protein GX811_11630, partial [Lentisphaerae bacterium]|nr:hypothetical protein [Lentisphaerota bacterium]